MARDLLAEFFAAFLSCRSYWFVINSLGDNEYDLIHHLGMTQLDYMSLLIAAGLIKIDMNDNITYEKNQWELFVGDYFDVSEVEYTKCRPTIDDGSRPNYHVIRIGNADLTNYLYEDQGRTNTFPNQYKYDDRAFQPPKPAGLRAEQRRLFRNVHQIIMKQIINSMDTTDYFNDYLKKIDTTDAATTTTTKEHAAAAAAAAAATTTSSSSSSRMVNSRSKIKILKASLMESMHLSRMQRRRKKARRRRRRMMMHITIMR